MSLQRRVLYNRQPHPDTEAHSFGLPQAAGSALFLQESSLFAGPAPSCSLEGVPATYASARPFRSHGLVCQLRERFHGESILRAFWVARQGIRWFYRINESDLPLCTRSRGRGAIPLFIGSTDHGVLSEPAPVFSSPREGGLPSHCRDSRPGS